MLTIELEQEEDGHWIAEATALPGTMVYGATPQKAHTRTAVLALRVIADRMDTANPSRRSPRPVRSRMTDWPCPLYPI